MSIQSPATTPNIDAPNGAIVENARRLIPSLRERAVRIAETRTQPDDVVQDLYDAGLMELMRPRRFGGQEHGFDLIYYVGRELAKGDASTSWVYQVTAAHDVFAPFYSEAVQEEYWTSARPVAASSYVPTGKATPANGGYTLSGKWSFCSGIDHAGWCLVGAIVGMLDNPVRPDMRFFLIPASQYSIIDDWYSMGLRGTGSKSIVVDDVFVPDERMLKLGQLIEGHSLGTDKPGYRESAWLAISYSLASPAAGVAEMAYELTVDDLRGRFERRDPVFEAKKPAVQAHLAQASVLIETASVMIDRSFENTMQHIRAGERLSDAVRVLNRRDTSYSVRSARQAVDVLMAVGGARVLADTHPVQRALRDLYAISAHPGTGWDSVAMSFGSVELGGPPTELMI